MNTKEFIEYLEKVIPVVNKHSSLKNTLIYFWLSDATYVTIKIIQKQN